MTTVTITHTAEDGTLATGDTRPHAPIFRAHRWRWSRTLTAWYIPHSRDRRPDTDRITATAEAIKATGAAAVVAVDAERATVAEREARRAERLDARREGLTAKAERTAAEADAAFQRSHDRADRIPLGQPILVGHHSERRHRRDLATIERSTRAAVTAYQESDEAAWEAEASERTERHRLSGPATMRRLDRIETEARDIARKLQRATPDSEYHARLTERAAELVEEVTYWQAHLADLEASGTFKRWSADDFAPGDHVITRFGVRAVVRVNAKSLTVSTAYSWTDTLPYDEVRGKVDPAAGVEDPQPPAEEPVPPIVVTRSGLQVLLPGQEPPPTIKGDTTQRAMF